MDATPHARTRISRSRMTLSLRTRREKDQKYGCVLTLSGTVSVNYIVRQPIPVIPPGPTYSSESRVSPGCSITAFVFAFVPPSCASAGRSCCTSESPGEASATAHAEPEADVEPQALSARRLALKAVVAPCMPLGVARPPEC